MELKQLAIFQAVSNELNFTRAAEKLNYAQSSVTAQIQALEQELGVKLFERIGKRVHLTEAGERLQFYAEKMLQTAKEAVVAVQGKPEPSGTITIGAPESLCTYRLSPILLEFRSMYPQVEIIFRTGICSDLRKALNQGALDCVFTIEERVNFDHLIVDELREEPLLLISSPNHPLATSERVRPNDLNGESILVTETGCSYRQMFERTLTTFGCVPSIKLEFASVEAIKQCVIAGLGVSLLPEVAVRKEIDSGQLAALTWIGPSFSTVLQLIWHKDKWMSPAIRAFMTMASSALKVQQINIRTSTR